MSRLRLAGLDLANPKRQAATQGTTWTPLEIFYSCKMMLRRSCRLIAHGPPRHSCQLGRPRRFFSPSLNALRRTQQLPNSCEQVYAVVADVERYKDFLPFCTAFRIGRRHGPDSFEATLAVGFLVFSETCTSLVTLERPRSVAAKATDTTLFSQLSTWWRFIEGATPETCELHFFLEMQLKSMLHEQALQPIMSRMAESAIF